MAIPFVPDLDSEPGMLTRPRPGLRRIVAPNPGPFTYTGTGTYIVGEGKVAVVDPGPDDAAHVRAILEAVRGEIISHILVTHTHRDHAPAACALATASGAKVVGCAAAIVTTEVRAVAEEAVDSAYAPDTVLSDGDVIGEAGWTLQAVATPGHTSGHLCFHWREENALFTGDHIMGWSTSVIVPPDGDMAAYIASLAKVAAAGYASLIPTHGQPVMKPAPFVAALIAHREAREAAILGCLADGTDTIAAIVKRLYVGVPKGLHPAAAMSVLAHLIKLVSEGAATADGQPALKTTFRLA